MVTLVDLPPLIDVDERVLGSGRGGDGWVGGDDEFGGWGWSEEPFEDDEPPYQRPRIVRVLAIVLAAVVIAGTIGAYVAVVTVGSDQQFPVTDVVAAGPRVTAGIQRVSVHFVVSNAVSEAGQARCTATVWTAEGALGTASLTTSRIPGGASSRLAMRVPLSAPLAGRGPAGVGVDCVFAGHRSS